MTLALLLGAHVGLGAFDTAGLHRARRAPPGAARRTWIRVERRLLAEALPRRLW